MEFRDARRYDTFPAAFAGTAMRPDAALLWDEDAVALEAGDECIPPVPPSVRRHHVACDTCASPFHFAVSTCLYFNVSAFQRLSTFVV